jgi:tetrapyrrole methylase family protein/MazG family protein
LKTIKIIGLGPGPNKLLTLEAHDMLKNLNKVYFRTIEHPIAKDLIDDGTNYESFDYLYDQHDTFDELYEAIAKKY